MLLCLIFPSLMNSQSLTGKVFENDSKETVVGATIRIVGYDKGTVSDEYGAYQLYGLKTGDIIIFNSVGLKSRSVTYDGQTTLDIYLEREDKLLDEMVVVGYGSQKRSDISGSVSVIKSDEITSSPALRVEQALQGRASGVLVTQNSGAPGAPLTVRIRGTGTINNSDPLFIVDGVPVGGLTS